MHWKGNQKMSLCYTLTHVLFYSHLQLFLKNKRNSKKILNIDHDEWLYCVNAVEEKFALIKGTTEGGISYTTNEIWCSVFSSII